MVKLTFVALLAVFTICAVLSSAPLANAAVYLVPPPDQAPLPRNFVQGNETPVKEKNRQLPIGGYTGYGLGGFGAYPSLPLGIPLGMPLYGGLGLGYGYGMSMGYPYF